MNLADSLVAGKIKPEIPEFEIGDAIDVHVRIKEGDKTRIQVFSGTVIKIQGTHIRKNLTVRRIVAGEGVERIFPVHAPSVVEIKVKKKGRVRRAKLYYLRDRVGKATRLKERIVMANKESAPAKAEKESAETAE